MRVISFKESYSELEKNELAELSDKILESRKKIVGFIHYLENLELEIHQALDKMQVYPHSNIEINEIYLKLLRLADIDEMNLAELNIVNFITRLSNIESYIAGSSTYYTQTPTERIVSLASEYDELLGKIRSIKFSSVSDLKASDLKKAYFAICNYEEDIISEIKETIRSNLQCLTI